MHYDGGHEQGLLPRAYHAAVVLDNLLYLVGGRTAEAEQLVEIVNLGTYWDRY